MLSQVGSFKYLGNMLRQDGKYDTDIIKDDNIGMAKASFGQLGKILTDLGFRIETKMSKLKVNV